MKKTRKLLSLVLAILVAFGGMPLVYTGTAAADVIPYAEATGTIDNPTRPISASGEYSQSNTNHLTASQASLNFIYYQTIDNEYFALSQSVQMQKNVGLGQTVTVELNSYNFDTDDKTNAFFNNHEGTYSWTAATEQAAATPFPGGFEIEGTLLSRPTYGWNLDVVFKGNSDGKSRKINTGYTQILDYTTTVDGVATSYQTAISTTLQILDARELVKEIEEAEYILANPDNYTEKYLASVEATLNTIPEDLRDFSKVYDQSVIDSYTQMMVDISLNSADYREYNQVYKSLKTINNSRGAFTEDSFVDFKDEIERINTNLPKNLDKTKQATVDAATQALRDAYNILVATDLTNKTDSAPEWTSRDKGYGSIQAELSQTSFKFMQTKDSQKFQFEQNFHVRRYDGYNSSNFHGMYFEENYPTCGSSTCAGAHGLTNDTAEFLSLLDPNMITTVTAKDENGTNITAKEFCQWVWDGSVENAGDSIVSNGLLIHGHKIAKGGLLGMGDYNSYAAASSPVFYGKGEGDYGEIDLTYIYRLGYMYDSAENMFQNKDAFYHWHIPTTIEVTDVRQLISAVAQAEEILANPDGYSKNYITALQAAVAAAPVEMLRGVEYHTQAEVDKLYTNINSLLNSSTTELADYSQFVEVFEQMTAVENESRYTEESFEAFKKEIYAINRGLDKNLADTEENQAIIDAATQALRDAYVKLEYYEVGNENVFTEKDITDDLGYSPIEFSVSSTEYNFMQTINDQEFAIKTEFSARKNVSNYRCRILTFALNNLDLTTYQANCINRTDPEPDDGCHGASTISKNDTPSFITKITSGVAPYAASASGDVADYTTWVSTKGNITASDGVSFGDQNSLGLTDTSGYTEITFTGIEATQTQTQERNYVYVNRFAWDYKHNLSVNSDTTRHVHIPVEVNITDARALNALYTETGDILSGRTDKDYTLSSLINLYTAYQQTPEDMAQGEVYHTQAQVDAEYAKLKAAYDALQEGADYSEYFEAYVKAQEIIATENNDGYGNKLYDDETFNNFKTIVEEIDSGLDKNLTSDENDKIGTATSNLNTAIADIEKTKYADYTALEEAITQAEKILAAEDGTYTEESLTVLEKALAAAKAIEPKNDGTEDDYLPASQQGTVDAVTSALKAAVEDIEYKADYSEFDKAYNKVKDIIDNPDKYTNESVTAAEKVMGTAGSISKDLADTANNRVIIKEATDELKAVADSSAEKADYTGFDEAYEQLEDILSNSNNYTKEIVDAAQSAKDAADALGKNQPATNQDAVNSVIDAMNTVIENIKEKADYTGFDEAYQQIGDILANPNEYTSDTVEAAQSAKDAADALGKDQPATNQDAVNSVIDAMNTVIENRKEKADYEGFDEAYEQLEDILSNSDKYTSETVEKAQAAKDAADELGKDQPAENQDAVDEVINSMKDAVDNRKEKADYTGFDEAYEQLKDILSNPDKYTSETVEKAQAAKDAADDLGKDQPAENQDKVNEVIKGMEEAFADKKEKADYEGFDEAYEQLEDILSNPDKYTSETVEKAQSAKDAADELGKDQPAENQDAVDEVINSMKDVVDNRKEKADYGDFDSWYEQLEDILSNPDKYTSETVEKAQSAKDAADELSKDQPAENQDAVDEVINSMKDVVDNRKEKADYGDFDSWYEQLEDILSNPDKYTSETVEKAQAAKDAADELGKDQPAKNQDAVDEVINSMKDVVDNKQEKADYTDYNKVLDEANKLENNGSYDENAFNDYKNAVEALDKELLKDLTKDEQDLVDEKTQELKDLRTELDATKGYEESVIDPKTDDNDIKNDILAEIEQNQGYTEDELIVEFRNYLGEELADESFVGTGSTMRVILKSTGELVEYKLFIVMGDVDGDGCITNDDYEKAIAVGMEDIVYSEEQQYFFIANDVAVDGVIDVLDAFDIRRMAAKSV